MLAAVLATGTALSTPARAAEPSPAACASAYEAVQVLRRNGRLVGARDAALVCAHPACPEVGRADCRAWAQEIAKEIPTVVVSLRDDAGADVRIVSVTIDGVVRADAASGRAFEIDPGEHVFRVERAGAPPVERSFAIVHAERDRILRFQVAAPPRTSTPRASGASYTPAIVSGVIAGGLLGVSAWLGVSGRNDLSQLRATCAPTCTDDQLSPVRRRLVASDVTLGAGLVAAALSFYFFVRPPTSEPAAPRVDVGVAPLAGGGAVSLGARF